VSDAQVRGGKMDFAQEHEQGADEGQHRRHEQRRDRQSEADLYEGTGEQRDDHAADQERAQRAEGHRRIDQARPPPLHLEFAVQ
jgi:hypothetical protein